MPSAPPHPCGPGCAVLVPRGVSRCPLHTPSTAHGWTQDTTRIRGRRLQQLRAALFAQEPVCRVCQKAVATIRDHIRPLAEGGTDAPENIQPLCQVCSDTKTQAEAARGQRRGAF